MVISHHMLMGLKEGQEKMSKSDPDSAIFMEDTAEDVKRKVKKAYCPPQVSEKNPILDYAEHIVLGFFGKMAIKTETEELEYTEFAPLKADYESGRIHPGDLKASVTEAINLILEPVRQHFSQGEPKALLEKVKKFKVTR